MIVYNLYVYVLFFFFFLVLHFTYVPSFDSRFSILEFICQMPINSARELQLIGLDLTIDRGVLAST